MSDTKVSEYLKATNQSLADIQRHPTRDDCRWQRDRCRERATLKFEHEMNSEDSERRFGFKSAHWERSVGLWKAQEEYDAYLKHHRDKMESSHNSCQAAHDTCVMNVDKNKRGGIMAYSRYPKKLTDTAAEFDAELWSRFTKVGGRKKTKKGRKKTKKGRKKRQNRTRNGGMFRTILGKLNKETALQLRQKSIKLAKEVVKNDAIDTITPAKKSILNNVVDNINIKDKTSNVFGQPSSLNPKVANPPPPPGTPTPPPPPPGTPPPRTPASAPASAPPRTPSSSPYLESPQSSEHVGGKRKTKKKKGKRKRKTRRYKRLRRKTRRRK